MPSTCGPMLELRGVCLSVPTMTGGLDPFSLRILSDSVDQWMIESCHVYIFAQRCGPSRLVLPGAR